MTKWILQILCGLLCIVSMSSGLQGAAGGRYNPRNTSTWSDEQVKTEAIRLKLTTEQAFLSLSRRGQEQALADKYADLRQQIQATFVAPRAGGGGGKLDPKFAQIALSTGLFGAAPKPSSPSEPSSQPAPGKLGGDRGAALAGLFGGGAPRTAPSSSSPAGPSVPRHSPAGPSAAPARRTFQAPRTLAEALSTLGTRVTLNREIRDLRTFARACAGIDATSEYVFDGSNLTPVSAPQEGPRVPMPKTLAEAISGLGKRITLARGRAIDDLRTFAAACANMDATSNYVFDGINLTQAAAPRIPTPPPFGPPPPGSSSSSGHRGRTASPATPGSGIPTPPPFGPPSPPAGVIPPPPPSPNAPAGMGGVLAAIRARGATPAAAEGQGTK